MLKNKKILIFLLVIIIIGSIFVLARNTDILKKSNLGVLNQNNIKDSSENTIITEDVVQDTEESVIPISQNTTNTEPNILSHDLDQYVYLLGGMSLSDNIEEFKYYGQGISYIDKNENGVINFYVNFIVNDSPASKHDIQKGDRLIKINNISVEGKTVDEVKSILESIRKLAQNTFIFSRNNIEISYLIESAEFILLDDEGWSDHNYTLESGELLTHTDVWRSKDMQNWEKVNNGGLYTWGMQIYRTIYGSEYNKGTFRKTKDGVFFFLETPSNFPQKKSAWISKDFGTTWKIDNQKTIWSFSDFSGHNYLRVKKIDNLSYILEVSKDAITWNHSSDLSFLGGKITPGRYLQTTNMLCLYSYYGKLWCTKDIIDWKESGYDFSQHSSSDIFAYEDTIYLMTYDDKKPKLFSSKDGSTFTLISTFTENELRSSDSVFVGLNGKIYIVETGDTSTKNPSIDLFISSDNGKTWNKSVLPSLLKERTKYLFSNSI